VLIKPVSMLALGLAGVDPIGMAQAGIGILDFLFTRFFPQTDLLQSLWVGILLSNFRLSVSLLLLWLVRPQPHRFGDFHYTFRATRWILWWRFSRTSGLRVLECDPNHRKNMLTACTI